MNWHPFCEKFPQPEGAEWDTFKASIQATQGNDDTPILFRMVGGQPQGLDGRTRYLACKELRIKPKMKKVSVRDEDVKAFVIRHNVIRRHMTTELRQELVAELREDGQSTRQIADAIGTSKSTVERDILETGATVPNGTVEGKDRKKRAAKKPPKVEKPQPVGDAHEGPILCTRCTNVGKETPTTGCSRCKELREEAAKADRRSGTRNGAQKNGQQVYDWRPFHDHFGGLLRQIDVLGKLYGVKESPGAEKLRDTLGAFKTQFTEFHASVRK